MRIPGGRPCAPYRLTQLFGQLVVGPSFSPIASTCRLGRSDRLCSCGPTLHPSLHPGTRTLPPARLGTPWGLVPCQCPHLAPCLGRLSHPSATESKEREGKARAPGGRTLDMTSDHPEVPELPLAARGSATTAPDQRTLLAAWLGRGVWSAVLCVPAAWLLEGPCMGSCWKGAVRWS